jgi:hypothetical protein
LRTIVDGVSLGSLPSFVALRTTSLKFISWSVSQSGPKSKLKDH